MCIFNTHYKLWSISSNIHHLETKRENSRKKRLVFFVSVLLSPLVTHSIAGKPHTLMTHAPPTWVLLVIFWCSRREHLRKKESGFDLRCATVHGWVNKKNTFFKRYPTGKGGIFDKPFVLKNRKRRREINKFSSKFSAPKKSEQRLVAGWSICQGIFSA